MSRKTILVVDADESLRCVAQIRFEAAGYETCVAADGPAGLRILEESAPALVLTALRLPEMSGMELLRRARSLRPETPVIIVTGFGTVENAVEAIKAGAYEYVTKPVDFDALLPMVERALNHREPREENPGFEDIIGKARPLLRVLAMAARAAPTDSVVLLCGETGTGKELLAKAIHRNSRRKDGPFVTINCGAIPQGLLESELFGHVRGSFTGAVAHKRGKVELADGGTLFLDEIGELPLELQVKILRLIQHGEIEKVGATESSKVSVRIVAATNRNLKAMVEAGSFREDLYYRLAVIPLELPPLRERSEDIPDLVQYLFAAARRKHGRTDLRLPESLLPCFAGHGWPGNVRELENVLERIVVLSPGNEVTVEDLPEHLQRQRTAVNEVYTDLPAEGLSLENVERELIVRTLKKFAWNQTQAARYLDISRRTLIYRMEKYGIRKD